MLPKRRIPKTLLSPASPGPAAPPPPPNPAAAAEPEEAQGWDDLTGKLVGGRYLVTGVLGRGGMGTVFEGEHTDLGRPVAVKVLAPEQAKKKNATQRFQIEARTAGAIGHPNICEVYDMGMLPDGCPYLVMERLAGQSLHARLTTERRLGFEEALGIVSDMLAGLAAAHDKNIVHRDIKPENVFLASEPMPCVKLVDFGVAKIYGEENDMHLTRTGMVMGTPYYMSPEQARGERDLDARVDVYASGVVLYEILAGIRPYTAPNYNALLVKIISSDPPPLAAVRPDLPPELAEVVQKAMARNRKERYQSAHEFRAAVDSVRRLLAGPGSSIDVSLSAEHEAFDPEVTVNSAEIAAAALAEAGIDVDYSGDYSATDLENMPTVVMKGRPSSVPEEPDSWDQETRVGAPTRR